MNKLINIPRGKPIKKITYTLLKKSSKKSKYQLKSQEKQENLVRLFFKYFTPRYIYKFIHCWLNRYRTVEILLEMN